MPKTLSAHNAVTAVVSMYGEIVAEQAAEIAEQRRQIQGLTAAVNALGEQLKEKSLEPETEQPDDPEDAARMAAYIRDSCGRAIREALDRQRDGAAEPAADRDEVRALREDVADVVHDGSGPEPHLGVRDGPPAPGRAGPEDGPGDDKPEGASGR